MKLTIDTKEDSHEEIKKAIKMLATIVGDENVENVYTNSPPKVHHANIFESSSSSLKETAPEPEQPSAPSGGGIFNMFGSPSSDSEPSTYVEPEEDKDEKPDKQPEIIIEY